MRSTPFWWVNRVTAPMSGPELAASPSEFQRLAAWVLLRAMMRLDPEWLGSKARLTKLYGLWKGVLAHKVDVGAKAGVERELRARAHALECVAVFMQRLPDNFSAPLLKPIVGSLLPPKRFQAAAPPAERGRPRWPLRR